MRMYILLILTISLINTIEILDEDKYKDPNTDVDLRFLEENVFESHRSEEYYNTESIVSERHRVLYNLIKNSHSVDEDHNRLLREIQPNDKPEAYFKQTPFETDPTKLPMEKRCTKKPWSGYYWAIRYGILSLRYNEEIEQNSMYKLDDKGEKVTLSWKESINKFPQPQDYTSALTKGGDINKYHNTLSASEKYDRLLCDPRFTLTNKMKERGKQAVDA